MEADSITIVANGKIVELDKNYPEFREISNEAVKIIEGVDSSLSTTSMVAPASGSPSTRCTAPEKIHGWRRRNDFSRPGFRIANEAVTAASR